MHTRLFDVLHDAADQHICTVTYRIDIYLNRIIKKTVEQNRHTFWKNIRALHCFAHITFQIRL